MGRMLPALLVAVLACGDRSVVAPHLPQPAEPEPPQANATVVSCRVVVATQEVSCIDPKQPMLPIGARADLVLGGQNVYVRLTSSGTSYDGAALFSTTVTVQNLTEHTMGTTDGVTVDGVKVFFHSGPTVTSGSGAAAVFNPDGTGTFTAEGQPFFDYPEILAPLQISQEKLWLFSIEPTVTTFEFSVYVSAPIVDETADELGSLWLGIVSSDWMAAGNWQDGVTPNATRAVSILSPGLMDPDAAYPVLTVDAAALDVSVGAGSSLDLNGFALTAGGSVDAMGAISGGRLVMTGADVWLGGTVPQLEVSGQATLQRPTTVTGAVTVTGSLTASTTYPLTIVIP